MNYITIQNNCLSNSVCDTLIKYFENNKEKQFKGNFGANNTIDYNLKNCNELYIDLNIEVFVMDKLKPVITEYCNKHNIFSSFKYEKFRMKRYLNNNNEFYRLHTDISSLTSSKRIVAIIIYLNDVEIGGETIIKIENKDLKIKPEKGKVLIFPANFCFPHEGKPPVSNYKYILVSFLDYN